MQHDASLTQVALFPVALSDSMIEPRGLTALPALLASTAEVMA